MTTRFSDTYDFEDLEKPLRRWPVLVEATSYYVVWVEGDSQKDAVESIAGDPEWYELINNKVAVDGSVDFSNPYHWHIENSGENDIQGPLLPPCGTCEARPYRSQHAFIHWHKNDCKEAQ